MMIHKKNEMEKFAFHDHCLMSIKISQGSEMCFCIDFPRPYDSISKFDYIFLQP